MGEAKRRQQYSPERKVGILREHLLEGAPVSDVCDRHGIGPSVFYQWQKQLFEGGARAFERRPGGRERELEGQVEKLEAQLREKNEVIAEVTQELVLSKKGIGGR